MKIFKLLLALILILGFVYYQFDKRLFYYGRNYLPIYHLLPFKAIPEYRPSFEGGFVLRDQDQVGFAGKGIRYEVDHRAVLIQDLLAYGFDAKTIIAVVDDSTKKKYYLKVDSTYSPSPSIDIAMNPLESIDSSMFTKWVVIEGKQEEVQRTWVFRNIIFLVIIILIPITVVYAIKGTRHSNQK